MSTAVLTAPRRARIDAVMGRRAAWAGMAVLLAVFVMTFRRDVTQLDDAYISYRYAWNLAHGNGLVFNPGEHVEGFTNLLWTLLVALGLGLGGDGPAIGHWLSVACSGASLVLVFLYADRLTGGRAPLLALLAPAGLLASNAFVHWTTSGLETPLFLALATGAFMTSEAGRRRATSALCLLAFLTRPEAGLLAVCLLGWPALQALARRDLRGAIVPVLPFAAGAVALTLFRLAYYHDIVPNTFYAKVGGIPLSRGLIYLRNALVDGPALLIPGALLAAWRLPAFRAAFLFVVLDAAYCVAVGGDVFTLGRFFLPALPALLAGGVAGAAIAARRSRIAGAALASLLPLCMVWSLYGFWHWGAPDYDFPHAPTREFPHSWKRAAARIHWIFTADEDAAKHAQIAGIRALSPPIRTLAAIGIGKLGYWMPDVRIIDMVGLTDRHIARSETTLPGSFIAPGHSRTDAAYVLSLKPDAIELPRKGTPFLPLPVILDMWRQPALETDYHYVPGLVLYVRNR